MMFDAITDLVSPGERVKLLDGVIFNVLICNSDSHAKNYSILIGAQGSAKLAPLYDLMCAGVHQQVDQSLAQSINGCFMAAELHGDGWRKLAENVGLSGASTLRRVAELADLVSSKCEETSKQVSDAHGDPTRVLERVTHAIAMACLSGFDLRREIGFVHDRILEERRHSETLTAIRETLLERHARLRQAFPHLS